LSRSGAIAQIDTLLSTITDPAFVAVYRGEPLAISGTPVLAFWMTGRTNAFETLGDIGSRVSVMIRAYFRMQDTPDVRESIEEAVWDAMYQIDAKLRSDADLGGNVTDSNVGAATIGYITMSGGVFRTVSVPFEMELMGEVTITP
tara:strand:- start:4345 stop:4779 length:435 start_codon:yes stop_codon:yes gene_type:complete